MRIYTYLYEYTYIYMYIYVQLCIYTSGRCAGQLLHGHPHMCIHIVPTWRYRVYIFPIIFKSLLYVDIKNDDICIHIHMHVQQAFVQGNYCKDIHTCVCTFVHTSRSCISFFESFPSLCCMWIFVTANRFIHKHGQQAFVQGNYCKDAFIQIKELDQEEAHQHLHKPTTRIKGLTGYHIPYLWDVTHS